MPVILVDVYELVLGMKFLGQLDTLILPHENVMVGLDFKCPCVVRRKRENW